MLAAERLVVALDVPDLVSAERLVERVGDDLVWVKIGLELFSAEGPGAVRAMKARGLKVFLDLKLHDIPTTVSRALLRLRDLGADAVNIHALGGRAMIEAARDALHGSPTDLWVVTILTSQDGASLMEMGFSEGPDRLVPHLARIAEISGAHGVIASGQDARTIRSVTGPGFHIITPGVRGKEDAVHDQRRAVTLHEALEAGADQVVLGRSVTAADHPRERFQEFLREAEAVSLAPEG